MESTVISASFKATGKFNRLGNDFYLCYFHHKPDVSLTALAKVLGVGGTRKWAKKIEQLMMLGMLPSKIRRGRYRVTPETLSVWFELESDRRLP